MRRTGTIWANLSLVIICVTTLWVTGCRSPRLGSLPGVKRLGWIRDRDRGSETDTQLGSTSQSPILPSASTTPTPPTTNFGPGTANLNPQSSAGGALASNVQLPTPGVGNTQYPNTSRPEVTYPGQATGGYYTGNYETGSAAASYNGEQPRNSPETRSAQTGGPQNGFYAAGPPLQTNTQGSVYTADTRSALPGNSAGTTPGVYGPPPQHDNRYGATPNQGLPNSRPYATIAGDSGGQYGGSGSRYTSPSVTGSTYDNPARPTPHVPNASAAPPIYGSGSAPATYRPSASPLPQNPIQLPGRAESSGNLTPKPWRPGSTRGYAPTSTPGGPVDAAAAYPQSYPANSVVPTGYQAPTATVPAGDAAPPSIVPR